jgi:hypothetical protein
MSERKFMSVGRLAAIKSVLWREAREGGGASPELLKKYAGELLAEVERVRRDAVCDACGVACCATCSPCYGCGAVLCERHSDGHRCEVRSAPAEAGRPGEGGGR